MIRIADVSGTPLHFLTSTRDYLLSCRETAPEDVRVGLNYNIILDTVLILEAESEVLLHSIIDQYERLYIDYYQPNLNGVDDALADNAKGLLRTSLPKLKEYVSKGTGMNHYISAFNLLVPKNDLKPLAIYNEGIQVLYQFRNVIAHGRAVRFEERKYYSYPDCDNDNEVNTEIDFMGGYKKVQDYLIKKKLLDKPITETHDLTSLFTDKICNHLIEVETKYVESWKKCVPFELVDYKDKYEKM